MKKIWQKNNTWDINSLIEDYTVWIDYILDLELIKYDILWSKAHTKMLNKIWILSEKEAEVLLKWLDEILYLHKKWDFKILKSQEDWHTAIESFLTEKYWEVWKKIHTWRSRNDQILVTTRLFTIDKLNIILDLVTNLINSFEKKIKDIWNTKMPGYTHMQKAMPSTVWMWLWSFKDSLIDDFKTGSSVMPQKKNWDVMELVRWDSNLFLSYEYGVKEIFKNLMSWYNRDFQLTKEPYLKWIKLVIDTIKVCDLVVNNLWINKQKIQKACSQELFATEEAYILVKSWMSFRDAYKIVWEKYS